MQQRCDCNNGTFPFRRCSSSSVTQRRRRATCLRTSASLCPSVDHTSSRCRLTFVCGTLLSVMHDSLSQVKLNEGIWELLGGGARAAAMRDGGPATRSAGPAAGAPILARDSRASRSQIGLSQLPLAALSAPSLHPHQDLACDGRPPANLNSNLYVRDIQLQKQGNAPLGKW